MSNPRMIGETSACLRDFFDRYPQLTDLGAMAAFCRVDLPRVQRWQREEYMPEGLDLLRTRHFLSLIGYEVTEWKKLEKSARQLAEIVTLDLVSPPEVAGYLGFTGRDRVKSLWRITLQAGGFYEATRKKIVSLLKKHSASVAAELEEWVERLEPFIEQGAPQPDIAPLHEQAMSVDMAVALDRMVRATTGLALSMQRHGNREHLLQMTGSGQSLRELSELLLKLADGVD